jgi:hypothetical protein
LALGAAGPAVNRRTLESPGRSGMAERGGPLYMK